MQNQIAECKKVPLKPKIKIKCIRQYKEQGQKTSEKQIVTGVIRIPKNCVQKLNIEGMLKTGPIPCGSNEHVLLKVNSKDMRKLCQTPTKYPFSGIGLLYVQFTKQFAGYGTAFLIMQNIVLTAAHNIYNRVARRQAKRSSLIIDMNDNKRKIFQAVCAYVPKQFKQKLTEDEARQFDFAILIIQTSQQFKQQGRIIKLSTEITTNELVQIYGYPADLSQQKFTQECIKFGKGEIKQIPQEKYMFGCQNIISKLTERGLFHLVDTNVGQSGSPILRFNQEKNHFEAVGIHTTGIFQENSGVRITKQLISRIKRWVENFWQGQKTEQQVKLLDQSDFQIIPVKTIFKEKYALKRIPITPDTQTVAWTRKKCYKLDNSNQKISLCVKQNQFQWLCSKQTLPSHDSFIFSIKAIKVSKWEGCSAIRVGVMQVGRKQKIQQQNWNHVVCLSINHLQIVRPNTKKDQKKWQTIKCFSHSFLETLPSIIQVHVDRQQNTIAWHYNGSLQTNCQLPEIWRSQRKKLCAIARIWWQGDKVEFV